MASKYKVGDVVRRISSGAICTVTYTDGKLLTLVEHGTGFTFSTSDDTVKFPTIDFAAIKPGDEYELKNIDAMLETVKERFKSVLSDAEAKAKKYRLALEECRTIVEDGTRWDREGVSAVHCVITDALKGGA